MIQYPIEFKTVVEAPCGIQSNWKVRSVEYEVDCSIPPEFEGPGGAFSPEDLYAQALTNCFVATYKVYTEKSKINFESIKTTGSLIVDLDPETKKPIMKDFFLKVEINKPSNPERAKMLAERAFQSGFILNSVKTNLKLEVTIV